MEQLREKRADRATGHNDRAFGTKWTARADRDCGRNRFQDRDLRLNQTAAEQNRFERFRDAVAADFLRAVARHQTNDQRTDRRRENDPDAEMMMLERRQRCAEALKKNEVRDLGDEPEQRL